MRFTKFTPIELLLLLAMSMLGFLSTSIEFLQHTAPALMSTTADGTVAVYKFTNDITAFIPALTVTTVFNHIMIAASFILSLLGLVSFLYGHVKVRKTWIYLQVPYWACQFLAFLLLGIYPIAAICIGLYFGASIYLALNQSLVRE